MNLLAVLAQPQQVGGQGSLGLIGILGSCLSLLLLGNFVGLADADEAAALQELGQVELARVEVDGAAEDGIGVVDVCAGGSLERVLKGDP